MKNKPYDKLNIVFGVIMSCMITLLMFVYLVLRVIDVRVFLVVSGSVFLWPMGSVVVYKMRVESTSSTNRALYAPVKLSLLISLGVSVLLILCDLSLNATLQWAYYPVSTIALWPIGMVIYNLLLKRVERE